MEGLGVIANGRERLLTRRNLIPQLSETRAELLNRHQLQRRRNDSSGQKLLSSAQGYRSYLNDEFVQEACVVKLSDELATTDDPNVPAASGVTHLLVNRTNTTACEPNVRALDWSASSTGKDPSGL